jgi:hypothetical protein
MDINEQIQGYFHPSTFIFQSSWTSRRVDGLSPDVRNQCSYINNFPGQRNSFRTLLLPSWHVYYANNNDIAKRQEVYDVAIKHNAAVGNVSKLPVRITLVVSQIKLIKKWPILV